VYDRRRRSQVDAGPDWLDRSRFRAVMPEGVPLRDPWERSQIAGFFVPRLSVDADEIEQATCGVQVRWPWLDVDLCEFFLRLPAETKYPDLHPRKLFVRELIRGSVPDQILDRHEKTVFNDAAMGLLDYGLLKELLIDTPIRMPSVDYSILAGHLLREDFRARDFRYIRNLAAIHAFLEEFRAAGT
jgi:hypothetical protein